MNPYHYERVVSPGIDLSGLSIQNGLQGGYGLGSKDQEDYMRMAAGSSMEIDRDGGQSLPHHVPGGWPGGALPAPPGARPVGELGLTAGRSIQGQSPKCGPPGRPRPPLFFAETDA